MITVTFKTDRGYSASMKVGNWLGDHTQNAQDPGVSDYTETTDNGNYWNW